MFNFKKIILSFLLCFGVAYLGSIVTLPSIDNWYSSLIKPDLNPPNWVFGPVWTMLYSLMAVSLAIVWSGEENAKQKKLAITFFLLQLILNFFWSFLFFYLHRADLASIEILILWVIILITIVQFKKLSSPAAYLLVPYILWVSFAAYLTISIWILNP